MSTSRLQKKTADDAKVAIEAELLREMRTVAKAAAKKATDEAKTASDSTVMHEMEALQTGLAGVKADLKKAEERARESFQKQEAEQLKERIAVAREHYKKERQDFIASKQDVIGLQKQLKAIEAGQAHPEQEKPSLAASKREGDHLQMSETEASVIAGADHRFLRELA